MGRDFAGRPIIRNLKIAPVKHKQTNIEVKSESDFDNYDRAIDENPLHIIGYREDMDLSQREKENRRIR